jgi:hypothetical protein
MSPAGGGEGTPLIEVKIPGDYQPGTSGLSSPARLGFEPPGK